jgi:hypothetical protein
MLGEEMGKDVAKMEEARGYGMGRYPSVSGGGT